MFLHLAFIFSFVLSQSFRVLQDSLGGNSRTVMIGKSYEFNLSIDYPFLFYICVAYTSVLCVTLLLSRSLD